jgi:hypothetical protein
MVCIYEWCTLFIWSQKGIKNMKIQPLQIALDKYTESCMNARASIKDEKSIIKQQIKEFTILIVEQFLQDAAVYGINTHVYQTLLADFIELRRDL